MNKDIMIAAGFVREVELVEDGKCPICHDKIVMVHPHNPKENRFPLDKAGQYGHGAFRDALSLKEFGISGMCQKCQDKTFTPQPDNDPCDGCPHKGTKLCKEECPV